MTGKQFCYVVDMKDTYKVRKNDYTYLYDEEKYAKVAATRFMKKYNHEFGVMTVESVNMMSGEQFKEHRDTPAYMSPACESYWSM